MQFLHFKDPTAFLASTCAQICTRQGAGILAWPSRPSPPAWPGLGPSQYPCEDKFAEELSELCIEDGVNDGVESAVDVPQPGYGAHQIGGDIAGLAHSPGGVHHKKGGPAEQKRTCSQERTDRGVDILLRDTEKKL